MISHLNIEWLIYGSNNNSSNNFIDDARQHLVILLFDTQDPQSYYSTWQLILVSIFLFGAHVWV